jgi:diguanylate cyclase (GGDEF)-like protein
MAMTDIPMRWTALVVLAAIAVVFTLVHREQKLARVRLWTVGWLCVVLYFTAQFVRPLSPHLEPWLSDLALSSLLLGATCFLVGLTSDQRRREALSQWLLLSAPLVVFAVTTLHDIEAPALQAGAVMLAAYGPVIAILRKQGAIALHSTALAISLVLLAPWLFLQVLERRPEIPLIAGLVAAFLLCAFATWHRYQRFTVGVVTLGLGFVAWAASLLANLYGGIELRALDMPADLWHIPAFIVGIGLIVLTLEERSQGHLALEAQLRSVNLELEQLSLHDALTKVHNRRYFHANVKRDVGQSLRSYADVATAKARDVLFFIIDLDHFKRINDTYGHATGDEVLVEVANRLRTVIRDSDMVVRWGGEEFLVVMSPSTRGQARQHVQRILQVVAGTPFKLSERTLRVTCSIGWAPFPWLTETPTKTSYEHVLQLADRALYMAKENGRNRAMGVMPEPGTAQMELPASVDQYRVEKHLDLGPVPGDSTGSHLQANRTEVDGIPATHGHD